MRAGMFAEIDGSARTVVLVEGVSDQRALETLAARRGLHLASAGVAIVAMGGSKNVRYAVDRFGPARLDLALAGLVDAPEEGDYRRALERAGMPLGPTRADLERLGFFVCEADLEDELIRALGPARVQAILEARGDLSTFRTFQRQPAQRGRPIEAHLDGSWARRADARRRTPPTSSTRSTSTRCRGRSTCCSVTCPPASLGSTGHDHDPER